MAVLDQMIRRAGRHPRIGRYDVDRWLRIYSEHPHNHANQISEALGRP